MKSDVVKTLGVVFILAFACGMVQSPAQAADERQTLRDLNKALTEIAQEVGQTVVGIHTERAEKPKGREPRSEFRREGPEYEFFFRLPERLYGPPEGSFPRDVPDLVDFGSGILLDNRGHIATVIEWVNDSDEITVTLKDGKHLPAKVIGADKATGIAVLKIDSDALPVAKFGDSDGVAIGELVLGLGQTADGKAAVSLGMISGLERNPRAFDFENWMEIDANHRPGSGGGAVVNTNGEIIGMSVANPPGGAFAIPINTVRRIALELIEGGKVARGWLGVSIQDVSPEMAEKLKLEGPMGALITGVGKDTSAAKAGLQRGDVITAVEGKAIQDINQLRQMIAMYKPESTVSVTVMRKGEKLEIPVTLGERTDESIRRTTKPETNRGNADWKGLSLQNLTAELAEGFGYAPNEGVLIAGVDPGSPAAEAGEGDRKLQKGDVILEAEQQPVHNIREFKAAVQTDKESILLQVKRADGPVWFVVVK